MYLTLPAEAVSGAIQHLVYLFTTLVVILSWIFAPR